VAELHDILIRPLEPEKGEALRAAQTVYTFEVNLRANKLEIKHAVEQAFGVKVLDVRTLRVRGKYKRAGSRYGLRSIWKKAYVHLADGHAISLSGV